MGTNREVGKVDGDDEDVGEAGGTPVVSRDDSSVAWRSAGDDGGWWIRCSALAR
jgi:hypothetical protein